MILNLPGYPKVRGVFVSGCIAKGEGRRIGRRAIAHAHLSPKDSYWGWICVQSKTRVGEFVLNEIAVPYEDKSLAIYGENLFDGQIIIPSRHVMHEVAHINTGEGHNDIWRSEMRRLRQPIPLHYSKSRRRARFNSMVWYLPCGCHFTCLSPRKKKFVLKCPQHKDRHTFTTQSMSDIESGKVL